jgi:hypothetical protein
MSSLGSSPPPQFGKAEYLGESGRDRCSACGQPVGNWYFRVHGAMACTPCAQAAKNAVPRDTHAAYVRALLFGAGGAVLGLILYSAFGVITGLIIGYLSLGVGYIVGKAMMMGSKGIGGLRYQIAAVLFTYAAVSMSAVPMAIAYQVKRQREHQEQKVAGLADEQRQFEQEFGGDASKPVPPRAGARLAASQQTPARATAAAAEAPAGEQRPAPDRPTPPLHPVSPQRPQPSPAAAFGYLALLGLASPFLELQEPLHGIIGLVILLVGIRIAWQLTAARQLEILGPFQASSASPSA